MGLRGASPTPTAILKLRGSWRGELNKGEPQVEPGRPKMPAELSPDQQVVWRRIVTMLTKTPKLLAKLDGVQLARYCVMLPLWWKLQAVVAKFSVGEMLAASLANEDSRAIVKVALKEARETHAELKRIEGSFGMTPADRSRISIADSEQTGALASEARKRSG